MRLIWLGNCLLYNFHRSSSFLQARSLQQLPVIPNLNYVSSESGTGSEEGWQPSSIKYEQGQYSGKVREYFYYIDHQGFLYLDDARMKNFTSCFKDKKFLHFFYTRVRQNTTGLYLPDFPYTSPCGPELNFIRCDHDDVPIVFTQIRDKKELIWGTVDHLTVPFDPSLLYMDVDNGRIYHPYPNKYPYVGLIASKIGIRISDNFIFDNNGIPVAFKWEGKEYQLKNDCQELLKKVRRKEGIKN